METICEEIKEVMKNIEADSKKIDCYAILDYLYTVSNSVLIVLGVVFKYKYHKKYCRNYIIEMDFETLDFEEIRKFCYIQPTEEDKDVCKSIFESFKQFCKKLYDINIYNKLD